MFGSLVSAVLAAVHVCIFELFDVCEEENDEIMLVKMRGLRKWMKRNICVYIFTIKRVRENRS